MNKVWIVEEVRIDDTVLLDVHASLESAQGSVAEWEKCDDRSVQYHKISVRRVQKNHKGEK